MEITRNSGEPGKTTETLPATGDGGEKNVTKPDIDLVIDGVTVKKTLEEVRDIAQKKFAAEKRFEEAAALRKEAELLRKDMEDALAIKSSIERLKEDPDDPQARRIFLSALGTSEDALAALEAGNDEGTGKSSGKSKRTAQVLPPSPPKKVGLNDLEEGLRQDLLDQLSVRVNSDIQSGIDSDPILGYYKGSQSGLETIQRMVREGIRRRVTVGEPDSLGRMRVQRYGSDVVKAAIAEVRTAVDSLKKKGEGDSTSGFAGVGRAPGSLGRTLPTDKPKRVPMGSPKYADYLQDRLLWEELSQRSSGRT